MKRLLFLSSLAVALLSQGGGSLLEMQLSTGRIKGKQITTNEGNEGLERLMVDDPPRGETPPGRVADFFARATGTFTRRPDFARAVLRAIAGSDRATAIQQAGFHLRIGRMIIAALRGEKPDLSLPLSEPIGTAREQSIALMLNHVWFAALLGWSSGLHGSDVVADRMSQAIDLMLGGSK